jgi:hypothetical protein
MERNDEITDYPGYVVVWTIPNSGSYAQGSWSRTCWSSVGRRPTLAVLGERREHGSPRPQGFAGRGQFEPVPGLAP